MRRHVSPIAATTLLAFGLAPIAGQLPEAHAAPTTVVTIGFDDGLADQYQALGILSAHGLHATFFVNSGVIGDGSHLSWSQLDDLFAAGDEIGGHTQFHTNVKKLKTQAARVAICDDRVTIASHGLQPESFAYPFGAFDAGSEAVVQACGYNSGRTERCQRGVRGDDPASGCLCHEDPSEPQAEHDA